MYGFRFHLFGQRKLKSCKWWAFMGEKVVGKSSSGSGSTNQNH